MVNDELVEKTTKFEPSDAPLRERLDGYRTQEEHYERLSFVDDPKWDGEFRDEYQRTNENGIAIIDAVASSLELTGFQKRESRRAFLNVPDRFNKAYATSLLAACICGRIASSDGREYHPNNIHPQSNTVNDFTMLLESLDVSYSEVYSCWTKLGGEL